MYNLAPASYYEGGYDTELLRRIENLIRSFQKHVKEAEGQENERALVYGLRALVTLANMVLQKQDIFGIEPWHVMSDDAPLERPGEMLLRLKDYRGKSLAPYPAIMAFYESGYTAEIDAILFLCALEQFVKSTETQASINISARSLRDPHFVKCTLERIQALGEDKQVIIEIHESSPNLAMCRQVLQLYANLGVRFAIDDVGYNMNDVMRLSEFEGLADFIKIDRSCVLAEEGSRNDLSRTVNFIKTVMPNTIMVVEGVQNVEHARQIRDQYEGVLYAQGLYLPKERGAFAAEFFAEPAELRSKAYAV